MTRATSPWQHPVVRVVLWLLGCYSLLSLAQRLSPLHVVLTLAGGTAAVVIYLLRFNPAVLAAPYGMRFVGPAIEWIARVSGEAPPGGDPAAAPIRQPAPAMAGAAAMQAPVASASAARSMTPNGATAGGNAEAVSPIVPKTPADYALALSRLTTEVRGHDRAAERLIRSIRQTAELRARAGDGGGSAPLGLHLLIGARGIGKRFLARRLAGAIYQRGVCSSIDVAAGGDVMGAMAVALRAMPDQAIVIEAAEQLAPDAVSQLVAVASGAPLSDPTTGARVSCRNAILLLLVHRAAGSLSDVGAVEAIGTGQTQLLDRIIAELGIDRRLAWALNGAHPMELPPPLVIAEVAASLMDRESQRFGLRLDRIDPSILAREVQVVRELGSFELTPSRVSKLVRDPAHQAVTAGAAAISLGAAPLSPTTERAS